MADTAYRILMIAPTPYFADRGCHVRIYEEARALRSLGHDVRIVTYHLGRDIGDIPVLRTPNVPWYSKLEAGPSWHKLYLDVLLLSKAATYIPAFRPHVIHTHLHEGAFIGLILKKLTRLPLLFDYQGSLTGECIDHGFFKESSFIARLFGRLEKMINNAADLIITSASAGATLLVKEWGQSSQRVIPLIDGVDTDIFCPLPQDEARKRFGLPLDIPIVAYLGLMNQYQGTDLLLDCIEILKNKGIKAFFLLMGFPCEKYRATAEKRGLSPFIRFTGKVDYADAPQLLAAADLAVTPKLSLTEANGKIFNYMSCGLAVAAFDTQVNREALGDTGVYAKFGNRNDLAEKIEELINSPQECRKLGRSSREKAVQEHSWLSRGKKLVTIYTGLIQRSDKPQP